MVIYDNLNLISCLAKFTKKGCKLTIYDKTIKDSKMNEYFSWFESLMVEFKKPLTF